MQTDISSADVAKLSLLDSVIESVTSRRRMRREDIDDFRQTVHLRLAERNGDIFRRFDGRSTMRRYLLVVVRRMLLDWQNHTLGKWRPSAAAVRAGSLAMKLERLIHRDGFSVDEAIAHLCSCHRDLTPNDLHRLVTGLPVRRKRRVIANDPSELPEPAVFDDPVERLYRGTQARVHRAALARALVELERGDRRLLWLRYRRRLTVRAVAVQLRTDPKPLYRRVNRVLVGLRRRLQALGVNDAAR